MPKQEVQKRGWIFGLMLGAGIAALTASFVLTLDKFEVLKNPDAVLSCTINAVLDCSRVMVTWQSSVFGFPNMIIGLMAFSVVITVAVAGLSRMTFARPFLIAAEICFILGTLFAYWLFFNSVYDIQILCPWCLVVTASATLMTAALTYFNLQQNTFKFKKNEAVQRWLKKGYFQMIIAAWLVLLAVLVYLKFGMDLFAA